MAAPFPYEAGLVGIAAAGFCALFAISYRVTVSVAAAIVIIAVIVMPIVVAIQTFFYLLPFLLSIMGCYFFIFHPFYLSL